MSMVVRSRCSLSPPSLPLKHATSGIRKTAEILPFGREKLPPLPDYARACAALIWATFHANSLNAVCDRAARETGAGCPDTFARILSGATKKPDGYLMQCVKIIAVSRGVAIPPDLTVRQP